MLFFSILQLVLRQIVQKIVRQIQGPANQILPWNNLLVIKYFQGTFMIFFTILQYMTMLQGHHGKFEPGKAQYSTPNFFDWFLIRAYCNPKSRQGPGLGSLASRATPAVLKFLQNS
jgi:hypothetical protein